MKRNSEIVGLLLAADANPEAPTLRLNPYTNGQWLNRNSKETLDPFDQTPLHIAAEIG